MGRWARKRSRTDGREAERSPTLRPPVGRTFANRESGVQVNQQRTSSRIGTTNGGKSEPRTSGAKAITKCAAGRKLKSYLLTFASRLCGSVRRYLFGSQIDAYIPAPYAIGANCPSARAQFSPFLAQD